MQENKKLPIENSELNSKINNLIEKQESQKVQTNQQGSTLDHHG